MPKVFIGGNWKCNNTLSQTQQMISNVIDPLEFDQDKVDVVVAPIYLHLVTVLFTKKQPNVQVAAQNSSANSFGAFTGEITAEQIKDINISWVIAGHSERRTQHNQSDETLCKKVENALKAGLKVIYCFGETLPQREENQTMEVIKRQLDSVKNVITNWDNVVLAYEPVWAIGTGKTATKEQVTEVHDWIRAYLKQAAQEKGESVRIIYGGSVNKNNCEELIQIPNVDGFLVGGASLKPDFADIVASAKLKK